MFSFAHSIIPLDESTCTTSVAPEEDAAIVAHPVYANRFSTLISSFFEFLILSIM